VCVRSGGRREEGHRHTGQLVGSGERTRPAKTCTWRLRQRTHKYPGLGLSASWPFGSPTAPSRSRLRQPPRTGSLI